MKKKPVEPTLGNILRLFTKRLKDFSGESKRSYLKAFSSFQLYIVGNYSMSDTFNVTVVENWVVFNIIQGLSRKTVTFYLEKISSLYSAVASGLVGGSQPFFKDIKKKLKIIPIRNYGKHITEISEKVLAMANLGISTGQESRIAKALEHFTCEDTKSEKESIKNIWACIALKAGVHPDEVRSIIETIPPSLEVLKLTDKRAISRDECGNACRKVIKSLQGEDLNWFALRMRPRVKFESVIDRLSQISDRIRIPELFYPSEEIVKKVGRKVVWEGKPIIRDIVFFKSRKRDIYSLICEIYDLAWCYKTPGGGSGNYASIPDKAMENFRIALGFLTQDFEVAPLGTMELKPGDKVVIIDGEYAQETAEILKKPTLTEDGNKIYRVTLLNSNGHWDIGIDARLLKKSDA